MRLIRLLLMGDSEGGVRERNLVWRKVCESRLAICFLLVSRNEWIRIGVIPHPIQKNAGVPDLRVI